MTGTTVTTKRVTGRVYGGDDGFRGRTVTVYVAVVDDAILSGKSFDTKEEALEFGRAWLSNREAK